jgi:DHA2 family multidrug resistance protein-like MFS transporter
MASSFLIPIALRRMRPVVAISAGLLGLSGAFLLLTQVDGSGSSTLFLAVYTAIPIISGFFFLPVTGLVIGVAPPERAGAAAGISQTAQELGGALGIAVLGSIVASVYRSSMAATAPDGVAPEVIGAARDTLAGAVRVATNLPAGIGDPLVDAARAAFIEGFQIASAVSSAIAFALAVLVVVTLRESAGTVEEPRGEAASAEAA